MTSGSKEDFAMKYVIKNCDNYTNFAKDWTCRSTIQNRKGCYCCEDITDCLFKRIVENLKTVINSNLCKNCDGCGYDYGCKDVNCGYYQAHKCWELIEIYKEYGSK